MERTAVFWCREMEPRDLDGVGAVISPFIGTFRQEVSSIMRTLSIFLAYSQTVSVLGKNSFIMARINGSNAFQSENQTCLPDIQIIRLCSGLAGEYQRLGRPCFGRPKEMTQLRRYETHFLIRKRNGTMGKVRNSSKRNCPTRVDPQRSSTQGVGNRFK
jgi:hypothetical protein